MKNVLVITMLLLGLSVWAQSTPEPTPVAIVKMLYSCSVYHASSPLCGAGENPPSAQTVTVNDKLDPNAHGPKADSVRVFYADGTNVLYVKAGSGR